MILAVALYGYTIRLPFFWDDVPHFLTSETINGINHWGDFPTFPYYRPVIFSIWKFFEVLIGRNDPFTLHLLNVFVFGLSGVVINRLAHYIAPENIRKIAGTLAGIGFILFPFSYRAIPLVGALFHLLLVLGFVLSFYLALRWIDYRIGRWGLFVCWLSAFLAVFSHENGVLLVPLFIGLLGERYFFDLTRLKRERNRVLKVVLPYILISGVYFFLWFVAFRPQGSGQGLTEAFEVAMAVLLQGLIYPFATLLRPLVDGDIDPFALIGLCLTIISLASVVVIYVSRSKQLMLLSVYWIGWYALAVLPAALFLSAGYVLGSPRLTMLASVGGSIFWAIVIAVLMRPTQSKFVWFNRGIGIALATLFAFVSVEFLDMRRQDFLLMGDYQWDIQEILSDRDLSDANVVFINLPDWIDPDESNRRFLLGTEGVLFVDPSADYVRQLQINADAMLDFEQVNIVSVQSLIRSEDYGFNAHPPYLDINAVSQIISDADHVITTQFTPEGFFPLYVGGITAALTVEDNIVASFENNLAVLTNAQVLFNTNNDSIDVITDWVINAPSAIKLFVHIYCDSEFVAQSDGYPLGDTYPFLFWESGEARTDIRRIALDEGITQDCLRVFVGLYTEADVVRLNAINPQDNVVYPDNAVPINVD